MAKVGAWGVRTSFAWRGGAPGAATWVALVVLQRVMYEGLIDDHPIMHRHHSLSDLRSMIRDQRKFHNGADCMGQRISARIDRKIWLAGRSDPTKSEQSENAPESAHPHQRTSRTDS
eukprot:COSAG01_NODE_6986_length_3403_cov_3.437651_5_plen_117_part_00